MLQNPADTHAHTRRSGDADGDGSVLAASVRSRGPAQGTGRSRPGFRRPKGRAKHVPVIEYDFLTAMLLAEILGELGFDSSACAATEPAAAARRADPGIPMDSPRGQ
jgi:hypothetical protein